MDTPAAGASALPKPIDASCAGAARRYFLAALVLCNVGPASTPALGQVPADSQPWPADQDLALLARRLVEAIEALSDYRGTQAVPPIFQLPQYRIEQKVCDTPCNVRAAYLPREGIYLSANLDPVHDPLARSALLHELVHYLQQGHAKFERMEACERERAKEREAYAIQNAYLATLGNRERVVFYDDFDCEGGEPAPPR